MTPSPSNNSPLPLQHLPQPRARPRSRTRDRPRPPPPLEQLVALPSSPAAALSNPPELGAPSGLASHLAPVHAFRGRTFHDVATGDDAVRRQWVPVWHSQHLHLLQITAAVSSIVQRATSGSRTERPAAALDEPTRALVADYLAAAASSHLHQSCQAQLARLAARARRATLEHATDSLGGLRDAARGAAGLRELAGADDAARALDDQLARARRGVRNPDELAEAQLAADELALRLRLGSAARALEELAAVADEVDGATAVQVAKLFSGKYRRVRPFLSDVRLRLSEVHHAWASAAERAERPAVVADEREQAAVERAARRAGVAAAQQAFAHVAGDQSLGTFLREARALVEHQRFVGGVIKLSAALALTVATGAAAGLAGAAAARAIVAGGEALELGATGLAVARGAGAVASFAVNVSLNSAMQVALADDRAGDRGKLGFALVENALMELASRGLAHLLRGPLDELRAIERQATADGARLRELSAAARAAPGGELALAEELERGALRSAKQARAGWFAAQLSLEVVMGMAAQWAANGVLRAARGHAEVSDDFALAVLQQGAAVMLGKRLGSLAAAWHARRAELSERPGFATHAVGAELVARRSRFFAEAQRLAESLSPEPAAGPRLLAEHTELLRIERQLAAELGERAAPDERSAGADPGSPGPRGPEAPSSPAPAHSAEPPHASAPRRPLGLFGDDAVALAAALRLPPLDGYVDVFVHGAADRFLVRRRDRDVELTAHQLHAYLRKQGVAGRKLRLVACDTYASPEAIAQHLADSTGVELLAPTGKVWVLPSGEHGVGTAPGKHDRQWAAVAPRKHAPDRAKPPSPLREELTQKETETDWAPPEAVYAPRFDNRATVGQDGANLPALRDALGVPVVRDAQLTDGVQVKVRRVPRLIGFDLVVTEVAVGERAATSDVLAHRAVIEDVERYNGLVANLRELARRILGRAGAPGSRFARGSRGWVAELELRKLDRLLDERSAGVHRDFVDAVTLRQECEFLAGRQEHYREILRSIDETDEPAADGLELERPDTGKVTREALAKGYRLPGADEGADPSWYYYRSSASHPGTYELALRPTAPNDAPAMRARVVGDAFTGFEPRAASGVEIPHDWTPTSAVEHLRKTEGFGAYLEMLQARGLASKELIDGVIRQRFNLQGLSGKRRTTAELRAEVRAYFRDRLRAYLCDPALDAQASWNRLRDTVRDLAPTDRGELAELWYRSRHLPGASAHVRVDVARTSGENAGQIERRIADAVDGDTVVEVKDTKASIPSAQIRLYESRRGDG